MPAVMSAAEDSLRARLAELTAAAAAVRREVRLAQSAACRARRAERDGSFNARARYIAVAVSQLTAGDTALAACFLAQRGGKRSTEPAPNAEALQALVRRWQEGLPAATLEEMSGRVAPERPAWMRAAHDFVAQARTAMWVYEQNTRKGFAPPSNLVRERLARERTGLRSGRSAAAASSGHVGDAHGRVERPEAGRQRVCRWRARWRASLARVRARDRLTTEEITTKVPKTVPKMSSKTGPLLVDRQEQWGHFPVPKMGPRECTFCERLARTKPVQTRVSAHRRLQCGSGATTCSPRSHRRRSLCC